MTVIRWSDLVLEEAFPGIQRARMDGQRFSAVYYRFAQGATFPLHAHREEQIIYLVKGTVRMVNGTDTIRLRAGESVHTLPNVAHSITAEDEVVLINVVVPRRTKSMTALVD